jgi:O-antigen/teichoic acid export membrane protein
LVSFFKRKLHNLISDKKFSEILTGSAWALGARIISTALAMVTSIIIARVYGAEMMGVVAIITTFLSLTQIFTVLGTHTAILRLIPEHMVRYSVTSAFRVYRKTQYLVAGVSIVTGSALFFAADAVATKVFSKPQLSPLFALSAVFVVFISIMNLNTQAVRGLRLIRTFAFMQLMPNASKLFVLVVITLFFFHPYNPVYAQFAAYFFVAVAGVLIMEWAFQKKMQPEDSISEMSIPSILSISFPMLMSSTMTFAIGQTGVIILGMFRPTAEVGYYDVAVRLATLTTFILNTVNTMAASKFSELYHGGKLDELFYVAKKSAKLIFWTTVPILTILVLLGKPIISLLYGHEFTVAYWAMALLVGGQFVNAASGSTGIFMNMTGNHKVFRNIIVIAAVLTVILDFALIPPFGIMGAAVAGMLSLVFWNINILLQRQNTVGFCNR